ncbi:MAG: hypothetical protein ACP5FH_03480 [Terracidiphilus sp.]
MPARRNRVRDLMILFLLLPWAATSQGQKTARLTSAQARVLEERALAAELRLAQQPDQPMRYRLEKSTPRLTSSKEIIETRDGDVARLLAIDGRPLTPAEKQQEQNRLDMLLRDPALQRHRQQSEESDSRIVFKLLRVLPNAFLYDYVGPGTEPSGAVEKFCFRPNPEFVPSDLETRALTAMSGEIWIDARHQRVMRLEGHLQQDTNYGWGLLGRLDKGGWVILEQADVGQGQWRIVSVRMKMNLRILFQSKEINATETMTGYAPVPAGLDYRQAIQMLLAAP